MSKQAQAAFERAKRKLAKGTPYEELITVERLIDEIRTMYGGKDVVGVAGYKLVVRKENNTSTMEWGDLRVRKNPRRVTKK